MWRQVAAILLGVALGFWLLGDDKLDTLKGKRVLVTGASTGIGEQLAYQYAQHGCSVAITARRQAQLDKVAQKCRDSHPGNATFHAIAADMKDRNSVRNMVKTAIRRLGGLDIVVLNHITSSKISVFTGSEADLQELYNTMDVNFRSYVDTTAEVLSPLTESEGVLVVVSSLAAHIPNPKLTSYAASKYALNGFFDSLRSQFVFEGKNIAVTTAVLGLIDTANALQSLKKHGINRILNSMAPASSKETALAIVRGSASRQREVFYPLISNRIVLAINTLFPSLMEWNIRYMMVPDAEPER